MVCAGLCVWYWDLCRQNLQCVGHKYTQSHAHIQCWSASTGNLKVIFHRWKIIISECVCSFTAWSNMVFLMNKWPFFTTLILSIHWVQCFICNVVNKWMPEYFNLMVANFTVHVISMIFSITEYVYVHIFRNILTYHFILTSVWQTPMSNLRT